MKVERVSLPPMAPKTKPLPRLIVSKTALTPTAPVMPPPPGWAVPAPVSPVTDHHVIVLLTEERSNGVGAGVVLQGGGTYALGSYERSFTLSEFVDYTAALTLRNDEA